MQTRWSIYQINLIFCWFEFSLDRIRSDQIDMDFVFFSETLLVWGETNYGIWTPFVLLNLKDGIYQHPICTVNSTFNIMDSWGILGMEWDLHVQYAFLNFVLLLFCFDCWKSFSISIHYLSLGDDTLLVAHSTEGAKKKLTHNTRLRLWTLNDDMIFKLPNSKQKQYKLYTFYSCWIYESNSH